MASFCVPIDLHIIYYFQRVHTDSSDRIVLKDVTTPVTVVTNSMVLVILDVTQDGRAITVKMVMVILNNNLTFFFDFVCCEAKYNVPSVNHDIF